MLDRRPALLLAVLLPCACESRHQENWDRLKVGMTRVQVEDLLGEPSSRYEPRTENGKVIVPEERWQYGDNLSTLATGVVFPTDADARAWAVYFDADGRVSRFRAADWATGH
jgi:outer membrane protein assembly factor BamE (lipoprotein component of BamABCDE complex)